MKQKGFNLKSIQPMNPQEMKPSPELEEVQVFFPMSLEDRERLREDIEESGEIRDPIKVYFNNNGDCLILGGKNRWEIALDLEWGYVPVEIYDLKPKQRKELALMDNLARRHMTAGQKNKVIEMFLKVNPSQSNRAIAEKAGVDHKTVSKNRKVLESTGEIPQLKETKGKDGKTRKVKNSRNSSTGEFPQLKEKSSSTKKITKNTAVKRNKDTESLIMKQITLYTEDLSEKDRMRFRDAMEKFIAKNFS